jgi:hypothetical protein
MAIASVMLARAGGSGAPSARGPTFQARAASYFSDVQL